MNVGHIIVLLLFLVPIRVLISREFYTAAREKGYGELKYFYICILTGIVGYLLVAALPDRPDRMAEDETEDEE